VERTDVEIARWSIKVAVWVVAAAALVSLEQPGYQSLAALLVCVAADVADVRFGRTFLSASVKTLIMFGVALVYPGAALLLASAAFDLAFAAPPIASLLPIAAIAATAPLDRAVPALVAALLALVAAVAGWIARRYDASRVSSTAATDAERAARYRLEEAQRRLDKTAAELVRATERAERTRIAHAIHDEVGHRLTGVLMQVQAAGRLVESKPKRCSGMLATAAGELSGAIASIRETVHDLRPRPESDAAAIRRLCSEFRFCPVTVSLNDSAYASLPSDHREACITSIRELLTNAARHSRARSITIRIGTGKRLHLLYRDDGVGASTIREGIGIRGIRGRIEALGGTVAVSGHDGFVVRCLVPLDVREE
jgi:signal transduction histidine kinase